MGEVMNRLGKYEILEEIGSGAFGRVFRAVDTDLEVDRAVSSLIKSYRAKSHKVVPVRLSHSIISRQAAREKGSASWYAGNAIKGPSSPIKSAFVSP
jgi:serine/threonine protein kinase